jgi:hypothetical protein
VQEDPYCVGYVVDTEIIATLLKSGEKQFQTTNICFPQRYNYPADTVVTKVREYSQDETMREKK